MNASVQYLQAMTVDAELRRALDKLPFSATGTRRICLHASPEAPLHMMLVESIPTAAYPAHSHSDSDEVSVAVEGVLEITAWRDGPGAPPTVLRLGDTGVTSVFMPRGTPHKTRAVGGNCVYLEIKLGPFRADAMKTHPDLVERI